MNTLPCRLHIFSLLFSCLLFSCLLCSSHVQFAVRMSVVQYFAVVLPKIDYANFCSLK
jgi:hypothetical protein